MKCRSRPSNNERQPYNATATILLSPRKETPSMSERHSALFPSPMRKETASAEERLETMLSSPMRRANQSVKDTQDTMQNAVDKETKFKAYFHRDRNAVDERQAAVIVESKDEMSTGKCKRSDNKQALAKSQKYKHWHI
ncbi:hypothetical protein NDU88_004030 [Pleurodeles waltl]|uniref:Uncharacterized protein n=1 Tax=Pleurodeles waltl TaxID=8319 RepID=A0AAV7T6D5_PLEWA|nr:hypothetical protein NDU88_004030 [Pleurodeles waltl]